MLPIFHFKNTIFSQRSSRLRGELFLCFVNILFSIITTPFWPMVFIAFVSLLFTPSVAHASVIILGNGDILTGKILEEKENQFVFQSEYGRLQVEKNTIRSVILNEHTIALTEFTRMDGSRAKGRRILESAQETVYLTETNQVIRLPRLQGNGRSGMDGDGAIRGSMLGMSLRGGAGMLPYPAYPKLRQPAVAKMLFTPGFGAGIFYRYISSLFHLGSEFSYEKIS